MKELSTAHVDLWQCVPEALAAGSAARPLALLSAEERARYQALRFERHRLQFLTAHAMLRRVLALYLPVAAGDLRFERNRWGRPTLANPEVPAGFGFSLSHTEGLVACAVALTPDLGIDVECVNRETEIMDVARNSFAPGEIALLDSAPPERRRELFFRLWTLKEAYVKAHGEGMSRPLDSFSFLLERPGLRLQDAADPWAQAWSFLEHAPAPGFRLAAAARLQAPHFRLHRGEALLT